MRLFEVLFLLFYAQGLVRNSPNQASISRLLFVDLLVNLVHLLAEIFGIFEASTKTWE